MNKSVPKNPKIYHIVHIDKLYSIVKDNYLFCDEQMQDILNNGTNIGMKHIKEEF